MNYTYVNVIVFSDSYTNPKIVGPYTSLDKAIRDQDNVFRSVAEKLKGTSYRVERVFTAPIEEQPA